MQQQLINNQQIAKGLLTNAEEIISMVASNNGSAVLSNLIDMGIDNIGGIDTDTKLQNYLFNQWYLGNRALVIQAIKGVPFDRSNATTKQYETAVMQAYARFFRQSRSNANHRIGLNINQFDNNIFDSTLAEAAPDAYLTQEDENKFDWDAFGDITSSILGSISQGIASGNNQASPTPTTNSGNNDAFFSYLQSQQNKSNNDSSSNKNLLYGLGFLLLIVIVILIFVAFNK